MKLALFYALGGPKILRPFSVGKRLLTVLNNRFTNGQGPQKIFFFLQKLREKKGHFEPTNEAILCFAILQIPILQVEVL